ncbi:hypothetical protein A3D71_04485 [Candidatus Kaiserbacteria bacterium RIFCSPHIGHO2_02_FULL_55_20]|uniref:Uncharacterized protein n=1 Tax=Candidatus Kaiserbacteria bacterium RIFCSPHIGHO2_02_FULL_55_20 TaxID=1798497 RepID=A0A1F6DXQ3_9BACT|nr:MAG: hypothetical protein A3D71_04485 [Candidatus Kaiserbacteria bacterium RIFCSPHIGHO2_02_FULL_55_20]
MRKVVSLAAFIVGLAIGTAPVLAQTFDPSKNCKQIERLHVAGDGYENVAVLLPVAGFSVPDGKTPTFTLDTQIDPADARRDGNSVRLAHECTFAGKNFVWYYVGGEKTVEYDGKSFFEAIVPFKVTTIKDKPVVRTKIGPINRYVGKWLTVGGKSIVVLERQS